MVNTTELHNEDNGIPERGLFWPMNEDLNLAPGSLKFGPLFLPGCGAGRDGPSATNSTFINRPESEEEGDMRTLE